MRSVSVEWLLHHDACLNQVTLFRDMFGEEAEITRAGLERAAKAGLSLDWLAGKILTVSEWGEYRRGMTPSEWARYERARISSVTAALDRDGLALLMNKNHDLISILAAALADVLGLPPSETEDTHG